MVSDIGPSPELPRNDRVVCVHLVVFPYVPLIVVRRERNPEPMLVRIAIRSYRLSLLSNAGRTFENPVEPVEWFCPTVHARL